MVLSRKHIRLRFVRRYTQLSQRTRGIIQSKLGCATGVMRLWAEKYNPPCVVAFVAGNPVGWSCLIPSRTIGKWQKHRSLSVYVAPLFRRNGIAERLVDFLYDKKVARGMIMSNPFTKSGKKFFNNAVYKKKIHKV